MHGSMCIGFVDVGKVFHKVSIEMVMATLSCSPVARRILPIVNPEFLFTFAWFFIDMHSHNYVTGNC